MPASAYLELLDWRRRVAELFADLRRRPGDEATLRWFRAQKDALFRHHPQSPIPENERENFEGLPYWTFDAHARVIAEFLPIERQPDQSAVEVTRIGDLR